MDLTLLNPATTYYGVLAVLLLLMLREWRRHPARFDGRDTRNNLLMFGGYLLVGGFWLPVLLGIYHLVWQYRLFDFGPYWLVPSTWQFWALWGALLVLEDFTFYWFHRASHRWGLFWASHVTHHSSPQFNFSTALRQSWVPFHTFVFWLPLPLLGFDPLMVITMQLLNLAWQAFLHTTAAPWPRPWRGLLNSPAYHRVHHASNPHLVDRNFGGILIVWDRLFGTFAEATPDIRFGVVPPQPQDSLLRLELGGWQEFLGGLRRRAGRDIKGEVEP